MYIKVILSKYLKPNRWPKSGPLALNRVLLVAQKWPVGKQGVKIAKEIQFYTEVRTLDPAHSRIVL